MLGRVEGTPWSPLVLANRALRKCSVDARSDGVSQRVPLFICILEEKEKEGGDAMTGRKAVPLST
jgi:hypothetical protein